MNLGVSRFVASTFGLSAFVVAVVAGMAAENSASRTLTTAIGALLVCHLLGWMLGAVAERIVADHLRTLIPSRADEPAQSTIVHSHPPTS